ncbi:flagellar motor switch protein FliG [Henriciella litoralis]|uniref:flagellar motor switch protein FliG n=1 Tax=Henriciella litoralis TaxID=568102 RepID=UPI0009FF8405|nr:FliG C-terminal domain-containing protein [Henriciella litoralis]
MSLLARLQTTETAIAPGVAKAARLMRALGPAAAQIWGELSPDDSRELRAAMTSGEIDLSEPSSTEAAALVSELEMTRPPFSAPSEVPAMTGIWSRISAMAPAQLANAIRNEHPQTIALILSRLSPPTASQAVRALPRLIAIDALRRLLHLGRPTQSSTSIIAKSLCADLEGSGSSGAGQGDEAVARIFDRLDTATEEGLLSSLDKSEPGARERIRALMFTFDDLARLGPAAIQTILSSVDRADLATTLKGASAPVCEAFFLNMTQRAGDMLRAEIEALGPVRRSVIDAARDEITTLARTLARRGDILSADHEDDELVE